MSEAQRSVRRGFADAGDVDRFLEMLGRYERGELGADAWRAFRLLRGAYPQRQAEANMLRVKVPQGILDGDGLRALAEVAERDARGLAHVTTRENVQLHFIATADLAPAMRRLAAAGLTTVEACGNSVRNVVGCPYAGVSVDEVFDPTPYAEAVTRHFLRHPLASTLPRKFKIGFEGCATDHVLTPIHDLGFRALRQDGRRGFAVSAAGGTATMCTGGYPIADFLPAGEVLALVEAVLSVFHRLGDREHRQRNRMKFLVKQLGWERFRAEVELERVRIREAGGVPLSFDPEEPREESAPPPRAAPQALAPGEGFAAWSRTNVRPQRQAGFSVATAALPLGDATSRQLRALAALASAFGDGTVRLTPRQDAVLRWVRVEALPALHRGLDAAGLARDGAGTAADVVSCPGADSCRLAVTHSRGVGRLIEDRVRADPRLVATSDGVSVNVSGCPNGCAQHHVAAIGLQGSARKVDGRAAPQYFVLVGGGAAQGRAHFGRIAAKVPARRTPEAVARLLSLFRAEAAPGEDATTFFARLPVERAKAALKDLEPLDPATAAPLDFVEPGEQRPFEVGSGAEAVPAPPVAAAPART
jgi:sulfite reductase (NADPH) hemoprotein beta-component